MNSDPPPLSPDIANAESTSFPANSRIDRDWLIRVVDRYERPLISYAARLLHGDWHRARDCVQETFLILCRQEDARMESPVRDHVEAWLFKCCRHRAMDVLRKESRMFIQFTSDQVEQPVSLEQADPVHRAIQGEERYLLLQQIAALSLRDQEVLALRLQQGLSYKQIAEVMDLSVSHVGVLIHEAVIRLRECLPNNQDSP